MKKLYVLSIIVAIVATACNPCKNVESKLLDTEKFTRVYNGQKVGLYTLKNKNGLIVQITNFGGRIVNLWVPDRYGNFKDVVLGFSDFESYLQAKEPYHGALIGRYGNRIAKGKLSIDGEEYNLAVNNKENHLHGGPNGFHNVVWDVESAGDQSIVLSYLSKDQEESYPGNLKVQVKYFLSDKNELVITYKAFTDKTTVVNFTNHAFFNLAGEGNGTINNHRLTINADRYTPVDQTLIPTGEIAQVANTPFDFTKPKTIGKELNSSSTQLKYGLGYDHNFVLNKKPGTDFNWAATVEEPKDGVVMKIFTSEPGLQFYGGNFMDGSDTGKCGKTYKYRESFALETQHFPDSPNHNNFPSTLLTPEDTYKSQTVYRFEVSKE